MSSAPAYNDLIFQLGDLARERLVQRPTCPLSMERVLRAEDALVERRERIAALEEEMNRADEAYQAFQRTQAVERKELAAVAKRFQKAVDGVEGRTRELRKQLAARRAGLRYDRAGLKQVEQRHKDLELSQRDPKKLAVSAENLKTLRVIAMRKQREIEELEAELTQALTPRPGQPGEEGLLAHKRLLEMEDEQEARKAAHEEEMAALDDEIASTEETVEAAEDYLDQALFLLGEECYAQRIADPALSVFYPKLDKAR